MAGVDERRLDLADRGRASLVRAWHRLDPWPGVPAGLEALRQPRVVAALSNGNLALLVDLVRHGGLRFDCLLSAQFAQLYKPEAEVYLTGVRLLGLEPSQVMMVAAHPFDLKGARAAGLRIADASVMPLVPSSNIQPAVMMVAERAAEMMRQR